jgi:hypothetical protein
MIVDLHAHHWPFETYARTFDYIRESDLSPADIDLILNHNAQRVLGQE